MIDEPRLRRARTLLFVPGLRPDRFEKALASGADGVILDLEDAVPAPDKDEARHHVAPWIGHDGVVVRINDANSAAFEADLEMLAGRRAAVMLAKAESPAQVERVRRVLAPGSAILPLIESAAGVLDSRDILAADGVVRGALGGVDLATQLGITDPASPTLAWASAAVVTAAAAAGIAAPLATPSLHIGAPEQVLADCRVERSLGFGGKLCIHPAQIESAHAAFAYGDEDLAWARAVLDAEAGGGATQLDGQMLDKPLFDRARRILADARSTQAHPESQKESHP
jgi:citrate lyase subunit beta/citryl-CoA lyase